jgi:hypothetical protein
MIIDNPSPYLKAVDFDGNEEMVLTIKDEGTKVESQFKSKEGATQYKYQFKVALPNASVKLATMNGKSLTWMLSHFGKDTTKWIGQTVTAHTIKQMVGPKMRNVVYIGFNPMADEDAPEDDGAEDVPPPGGPDGV